MSIEKAFNESVEYYDSWIEIALPGYNEVFQIAKNIISFKQDSEIKILDLGAGTGLFSKYMFEKYSNAHYTLYDVAEKMMDVARLRFSQYDNQFEYIIGDYRELKTTKQFDVVISSLSIHHLLNPEKEKLFKDIFNLLSNNGIFLNLDQVKAETDILKDLYWEYWLNNARGNGASEEQIKSGAERRILYDKDATLNDQLIWLKRAGFTTVDCIYKNFFISLFYAVK